MRGTEASFLLALVSVGTTKFLLQFKHWNCSKLDCLSLNYQSVIRNGDNVGQSVNKSYMNMKLGRQGPYKMNLFHILQNQKNLVAIVHNSSISNTRQNMGFKWNKSIPSSLSLITPFEEKTLFAPLH